MSAATDSLSGFSAELARVAEAAGAAVVHIRSGRRAAASGFFWREGLVVCADESLRDGGPVSVQFAAGRREAELIGRDPSTDIALLRVQNGVAPATLTPHAGTKPGEVMLAVGRAEDGIVVRLGVLSRVGAAWQSLRGGRIDRLMQLDMRLDRLAEGGLLVDAAGRAAGMAVRGPRRTALAIPAATIERVAARILEKGSVRPGYLGLGLHPVAVDGGAGAAEEGLIVLSVAPGGPAKAAGVLQGDIIATWNGEPVGGLRTLFRRLGSDAVGQTVALTLVRGGQRIALSCVIGERPAA